MATQLSTNGNHLIDNEKDVNPRKAFDEQRSGVKGLVDAGLEKIPKFFIRSSEDVSKDFKTSCDENLQIPIVDFAELDRENAGGKAGVVEKMIKASENWGMFQVVNHGVPLEVQNKLLEGVKMFHEQDAETKFKAFNRDMWSTLAYFTNHHLHKSSAAAWRDTLCVRNFFPPGMDAQELPSICRDAVTNYTNHVKKFAALVLELIFTGLGLDEAKYKVVASECAKGFSFYGHYYPPCPEPELALGLNKHIDPSFVTVLLQDHIGGLQVLHHNSWVNVKPVPGALIVVVGCMLQMLTNDKLKGFWHRAIVNKVGPRITATTFFTAFVSPDSKFAPIKELTSEESPPIYRQFTPGEVIELASERLPKTPVWAYFKKHKDGDGNDIVQKNQASV